MASNNSTAKTHVSLRLPTYLLESIDAHAERESISRTEAFVHYLQTGLEISDEKANEPSADEALLQSIQSELAEIKAMLKAGGASVPAAAIADEDDTMVPVSFTSEEEEEDEIEAEDEFTTSDAVYEGTVEIDDEANDEGESFSEGAEDEAAAMFDASDAVASPDEMPVEEVAPAASMSNVFSPNYQPAAATETIEDAETDEPMETLSDYYEEAAAEQEAEDEFTGSDAIEEGEIEDNPYVSSSYFSSTTEEDEDDAEEEEEFSGSDAVFEDASDDEDEDDDFADDDDDFTDSDEVIDVEEVEEDNTDDEEESYSPFSTSDAVEVEDDYNEDADDDEDEFTDSDEVFATEETEPSYSYEEAADLNLSVGSPVVADYSDDDEDNDELDIDEVVYVEPLALSDLEDAVNLVAQQFPMIEKVWLFGNAATGGAIEQDTIDLCVKADKFKSKYADLFISMLEDNTGKSVNVVLRSEMEKSVKQIWKATRIDLYRA